MESETEFDTNAGSSLRRQRQSMVKECCYRFRQLLSGHRRHPSTADRERLCKRHAQCLAPLRQQFVQSSNRGRVGSDGQRQLGGARRFRHLQQLVDPGECARRIPRQSPGLGFTNIFRWRYSHRSGPHLRPGQQQQTAFRVCLPDIPRWAECSGRSCWRKLQHRRH